MGYKKSLAAIPLPETMHMQSSSGRKTMMPALLKLCNSPDPSRESSSPATMAKPFRLLDLPTELRNRTYSYALTDKSSKLKASNMRVPPLIHVSRQVRQETVPLLFADSNFAFDVPTNVVYHAENTMWPKDLRQRLARISGILGSSDAFQDFVDGAGNSAIFRNVTLNVYDAAFAQRERREDQIMSTLKLVVEKGRVRAEIVDRPHHPRLVGLLNARLSRVIKDFEAMMRRVVAVAKAVADREGFKGFTLTDLRTIAKECAIRED